MSDGKPCPAVQNYGRDNAAIELVIVFNSFVMVLDKVVDPLTTTARTASRTKAYSNISCPDSSLWNLLTNS